MKKKILALCLVVVLAVTAVTGVTLAYFTDTDTVENTFTMGKVDIELDEALVDEDGKAADITNKHNDRVKDEDENGEKDGHKGNNYTDTNMVPGHVFDKDPTIHVKKGSEDSYIFLDMNFNKYSSLFWVMAADAADDDTINLPLYKTNEKKERVTETKDGVEYYVLDEAFQNDNGVFSTTKFLEYMVQTPENMVTMRNIINKWFTGIVHENWEICDFIMKTGEHETYITFRFAYKGNADETPYIVETEDITGECLDIEFMKAFQMPASVTQRMISDGKDVGKMQNAFNTTEENFNMDFIAYAIQADEMNEVKNDDGEVTKTSLQAAYEALFGIQLDKDYVQLKSELKAA